MLYVLKLGTLYMSLFDGLNKEQKKAVTYENGPLLIVAGAGTGKTTVITKRIAWLIENGKAKSDEILALTFTDKAAGEMEERVDLLLPYGYFDLWIQTFHSFCDRILRNYALDIGLPTNYKLLSSTEQWILIRRNLDKFNLDYYRPFGNPTKFIHALIKHFSRCKDEGILPADYLGYTESLRLNQDNAESGCKKKKRGKMDNTPFNSISSDKENAKYIQELELKKSEEVANAYHIYQQILLDNDALDFGDLIGYTLNLFKKRPNILEKFRNQFKYILIDEFQDTNWAQYELIKMMAYPANNITCVADDDQSIYLFRGSSVNNVLQFAGDYPKCEEIVLTENYRSAQEILDLSYKFIQANNPNRLEYRLNQDEVMKERAKEKGINLDEYKKIDKKLKGNINFGGIIEHLQGETLEDEVKLVIKKILEIKNNDHLQKTQWSDFAILVRANDSAKPFINGLERAKIPYQFYSLRGLYNKSIILDICAYFKLLDNYHESVALYRVLNMPIWKISHNDFAKINYEAFRKGKSLYYIIKNSPLIKELREETVKTLERIINLVNKHGRMALEKNVSHIFTAFLDDSKYLNYLTANENEENNKSLKYLGHFYKKIKDFESAENEPKLKSFLEQIEMEVEAGDEGALGLDLDAGPDMVRIMTIHSAKGLEFSYVFIVNLVDKKFPTIERKDPIEIPEPLIKEIITVGDIHLQEERRLFYVAMTRAKKGLFFTSAKDYGGQREKKISRFLTELGYSLKKNDKLLLNEPPFDEHKLIAPLPPSNAAPIYFLPKQFSYTQLAAFEKCPLQYKFAHILRIPIKGKETFSFGKTIHLTLQRFFALMTERKSRKQDGLFDSLLDTQAEKMVDNNNNLPTEKDLLKIYEECWIDEWYENDERRDGRKKAGAESLKEFYEIHKNNWPDVLYLEKSFTLKIGNYTLKGAIDRIDLITKKEKSNGVIVEVIDYKTGNAKDEKSLKFEDKEQLLIYQLAAVECLKINPAKLTFYYVEGNKAVSFLGNEEELNKIKLDIFERIEKIKQSKFLPKPSHVICEWCDFSSICEHRV